MTRLASRIRTGTLVAYRDRGAIEIAISAGDPYDHDIRALCLLLRSRAVHVTFCCADCRSHAVWVPDVAAR